MNPVSTKPITLRRDGKGPLKFNGERIGSATRRTQIEDDNSREMKSYQISAKLFKTTGGKFVLGLEVYNQTDEEYEGRDGWVAPSLEESAKKCQESEVGIGWLDKDILAELFENTEIGDSFVEHVD